MGKLTHYRQLPDHAYDPRVTDLSRPLRPPAPAAPSAAQVAAGDMFRNRNVANTTPMQLVANAPSVRVLPANYRRTGMIIQNKDTTADLFYSFGVAADANSHSIPHGGYVLLDFTTPNSELYLFATANVLAVVTDMTRQAG